MRNEADTARHMAQTDYLTGLANRRGLYDFFEEMQSDWTVHAMFIDVDNFKRVNDVFGHSMGDALLKDIAKLIDQNTNGFVSRIGGDEFVVIFDGTLTEEQLLSIAAKLQSKMPDLSLRKDVLSFVSLSIGIVLNQGSEVALDDILAKCDSAMYSAKFNGKGCCKVYRSDDSEMEISRSIEHEMEPALASGDFQVYFQPKINMITSAIYGAEALSRWVHPVDGVRLPNLYIPFFERNGFIAKLDMFIFEETCKYKAAWKDEIFGHIPVSVNMSRLHLYNKDFPDELLALANKYQVPTNELEIEIIESVFIKDNREMISTVDQLQKRGFLVSIDDFGSGFSALNLLKDISVNTIKLDKEFLHLSSNDTRGKKVIKNVIAMCKDLKLDIVSEGVETKDQIEFLTSCGCKIAQGFYYSEPVPVDDFVKLAREYSVNPMDCFEFRFNGNLNSYNNTLQASFTHKELEYVQGIYSDSKAVRFNGGEVDQDMIEIPAKALVSDSYTISMWIRPIKNSSWTSALYVKYESGFMSMIPLGYEGMSDFRIRDSREVNGWYDITGCQLQENVWLHFAVSYNEKTETGIAYINGEVVGHLDGIPTNHFVKRITMGGDVFQKTFVGDIAELIIYNETKDSDFIADLHQQYIHSPNFIAFDLE